MEKQTLKKLIAEKKLILVCGSGGVGKTTTAASIALHAATMGRKVIVLTIDPARRLATSLGLEKLDNKARKIDPKIPLWAMMLDTKSTFDQLVFKYAPTEEARKKILNNKIYRHLSSMIAGSQEYMAMEKLYEFVQENRYDLIVIDTPPTTHAIDFLNAPKKMVDALGHSMIHLLLKPALLMGKKGLKLFEKGSQMILKIFDRITGFAFLQDISEMLISFQSLLGGFQSRAEEVQRILSDANTSFLLVAACEQKSIEETSLFVKTLKELNLPLGGIFLNRVHPYYEKSASEIKKDQEILGELVGEELAEKMKNWFERFEIIAKRDLEFKKTISDEAESSVPVIPLPLFDSDIHDLEGLHRLGEYF